MYGLTVATAAASDPITLDEAKDQCNVARANGSQDPWFKATIKAATDYVQRYTSRQLVNATFDFQLDMFPCGVEPIYLPRAPLSSVTSVTYLDTSNVSTVWSSGDYRVITSTDPGKITLGYQEVYPATYSVSGAITVRFVAGYGSTAASAPDSLKAAIKLLISHWFENRSPVGTVGPDIAWTLQALLDSYRVPDEWIRYDREALSARY